MLKFYREICKRYPEAERIDLIADNWPQHYHPELLAHMEEQETAFVLKVPFNWKTEQIEERAQRSEQKRAIICCQSNCAAATYAPWTNPTEKLWRKLRRII